MPTFADLNKHRNSPKRRIMDDNINYIGGSTIGHQKHLIIKGSREVRNI